MNVLKNTINVKNKMHKKCILFSRDIIKIEKFRYSNHKVTKILLKKISVLNKLTDQEILKFNSIVNSRNRAWFLWKMTRKYRSPRRTVKFLWVYAYLLDRLTLSRIKNVLWFTVKKLCTKTCIRYLNKDIADACYKKVKEAIKQWIWYCMNKVTDIAKDEMEQKIQEEIFLENKRLVDKFNEKYYKPAIDPERNMMKFTETAG